jgi:hypothetical protein
METSKTNTIYNKLDAEQLGSMLRKSREKVQPIQKNFSEMLAAKSNRTKDPVYNFISELERGSLFCRINNIKLSDMEKKLELLDLYLGEVLYGSPLEHQKKIVSYINQFIPDYSHVGV